MEISRLLEPRRSIYPRSSCRSPSTAPRSILALGVTEDRSVQHEASSSHTIPVNVIGHGLQQREPSPLKEPSGESIFAPPDPTISFECGLYLQPPSVFGITQGPGRSNKRLATAGSHPLETQAKEKSKWGACENTVVIQLRGSALKWDDISERLPGRSTVSCRLHYQNSLERRQEWEEATKTRLAVFY